MNQSHCCSILQARGPDFPFAPSGAVFLTAGAGAAVARGGSWLPTPAVPIVQPQPKREASIRRPARLIARRQAAQISSGAQRRPQATEPQVRPLLLLLRRRCRTLRWRRASRGGR